MFAFCVGYCVSCSETFTFNPLRVPSVLVNGVREPVCRVCIERANPERIARGLEPIRVLPDAYEACDESELDGLD